MDTIDEKVSGNTPQSSVWGDYAPGKVFWDEKESPANAILLDADTRLKQLDSKKLKSIKQTRQKLIRAIAQWDFLSYPAKLNYFEKKAKEADTKAKRNEWKKRHKELVLNPPQKPKRRKLAFLRPKQDLIIQNEKEAQKCRLMLDKINKRLAEHTNAMQNELIYKQLAKEMQLEVGYFAQRIIARWTALQNYQEIFHKGKTKRLKVRFEKAIYTEDEIQYKIKVANQTILGSSRHVLPDDVTVWDLVKPETLAELTSACERPVGSPHDENKPESFQNGAWLIVYREGLTDGLFDYVDYAKVITKYDANKIDRLPVPIGVMRGRLVQWLYLDEHPHLMVNGITGSGKTNAIRVSLVTWCQYHRPDEIRFYLVDLKRGGDFRKFSNIPHLARPIMNSIEELDEVVPSLVALMYKRMAMFNDLAVRDIGDYNKQFDEKMEHIVIVIDECSAIKSLAIDKDQLKRIWRALGLISTQARAAGIHLLLGTQQSFSESIPRDVRDNITFILSGRQRTLPASMATFGTGRAKKLPNIRGRMWCDNGGDLFQVQTPYCSEQDVDTAIAIAMQHGEFKIYELPGADEASEAIKEQVFGVDDVIRIAIEELEGALVYRKIYALEDTPKNVSQNQISELVKEVIEMESVNYKDDIYLVKPNRKGWKLEKTRNSAIAQNNTGTSINTPIDTSVDTSMDLESDYLELAGD